MSRLRIGLLFCVSTLVWPLAALGAPYPGVDRIAAVEVRAPPAEDAESLRSLIALRPGQPLLRSRIRRTVKRLYETGRFRQARVYGRMTDAGVVLTVVLLPKRRIAEVSFFGNTALSDRELARAAELRVGEELKAGDLEAAKARVEGLLAEAGFRRARIETEVRESPNGAAALAFRIDEGPRMRLAGIRFEGDPVLPSRILVSALGLEKGDYLDLRAGESRVERLREIYRARGFLRARLGEPRVESAAEKDALWGVLVVPISAGPKVRIRITGNTTLSEAEAFAALKLPTDRPLDQEEARRAAERLVRYYRRSGLPHAEVEVEERVRRPGELELRFAVREGEPVRVVEISFPGATAFPTDRLRREVCEAVEAAMPPAPVTIDPSVVAWLGGPGVRGRAAGHSRPSRNPDPCAVLNVEAYEEARKAIVDMYHRNGWLSAEVGAPRIVFEQEGRIASVAFPIDEGVQTLIATVEVRGVDEKVRDRLKSRITLKPGEPLSYLDVEEARLAILRDFEEHAHPFARVEARVGFDAVKAGAQVVFEAEAGPQVRIGRVIVRGHQRTSAGLVRSRLAFGPGDPWEVRRVRRSQQNLLELGIYRSATIRLLEPDSPSEVMDAVVVVDERPPMSVEMGLGLSTEDGPRTFMEFAHYAMPLGSELDARVKANYPIFDLGPAGLVSGGPEWAAHVGLKFPALLGARTDVVWERDNRPAYSLTRLAWSVGSSRQLLGPLRSSMVAEVEFDDLAPGRIDPRQIVLTQTDRERLRLEEGKTLLTSVRPGLTLDLRDDRLNPNSGFLAAASLDWSHDLGIGRPIHFLKATATVSGYVPAAKRVTLALSARGGRVFALSKDNVTIGPKRFYLGGGDSLRGFPVDSVLPDDQRRDLHEKVAACRRLLVRDLCDDDILAVLEGDRPLSAGGQTFVLVKSELRFPIWRSLKGGVFVDVGNLWNDDARIDLLSLRTAAGAGLRIDTPVGPVALDVGVNLSPDPLLNEKPVDFHLRIGLF